MNWTESELKRAAGLIREIALASLGTDLRGFTVVTEAATGPFAVTASIAAMAGAKVEAVAADSIYGTAATAGETTLRVARACGVSDRVRIVDRATAAISEADVITNLGPIRPLDSTFISRVKPGAVIPLMYDAREMRIDEIDLQLCESRGISVIGTNEDHPVVDVLRYCGHLAAKMLLEQNLEVLRSRVALMGNNLFTPHVGGELHSLGANLFVCHDWAECRIVVDQPIDALIYIDYWNRAGQVDAPGTLEWLAQNTGARLFQFVGGLDLKPFQGAGWRIFPERALPAQRMWRTLADLGLRPVIELNAAGLKGAEMELRGVPHSSGGRLCGLRQQLVTRTLHTAEASDRLVTA
jgi:hypothetical protein